MTVARGQDTGVDGSSVDGRGNECCREGDGILRIGRDRVESVVGEEDERGSRSRNSNLADVVARVALYGVN